MFQFGCVMDKCGMKAVPESKSDCFAHRRISYLGRLAGPHPPRRVRQSTPMSPIGEIVNGRRRITTPWHGGSAWRFGQALDTTPEFWANLQADHDLLTFDPSTLDDIRPLVEA